MVCESRIQALRDTLQHQKGQAEYIQQSIVKAKKDLKVAKRSLKRHENALDLIRAAALRTQQQIQFHISDVVTSALDTVFDDPYEMLVEFVQRRNKTECDMYFVKDGNRLDPLQASGCGAVDIASFALRVAVWAMNRPRTRNTIILDEPFKHLSVDLLPAAGDMLQQISGELGVQIIIVTHSEELTDSADRVFSVSQNGHISRVSRNE